MLSVINIDNAIELFNTTYAIDTTKIVQSSDVKKIKDIICMIPEYCMFVHPCADVDALLQSNPSEFHEHFEVTISDFSDMIDLELISKAKLDVMLQSFKED